MKNKISEMIKTNTKIKLGLISLILILIGVMIVISNTTQVVKFKDKKIRLKISEIKEQDSSYCIGMNDESINLTKYNEEITIDQENKFIDFINVDEVHKVRYKLIDSSDNIILETGIVEPRKELRWNVYKYLEKGEIDTVLTVEVLDDNLNTKFEANTDINIAVKK